MMKDIFSSKWIRLDTDTVGVQSIVCVECGFGLGNTDKISEKDFPKDCPKCKRHMRNGFLSERSK